MTELQPFGEMLPGMTDCLPYVPLMSLYLVFEGGPNGEIKRGVVVGVKDTADGVVVTLQHSKHKQVSVLIVDRNAWNIEVQRRLDEVMKI